MAQLFMAGEPRMLQLNDSRQSTSDTHTVVQKFWPIPNGKQK